jgi:hypothetical protein
VGGVDAVWAEIAPHLSDPRWHETLRLLIAGYEQPEAEGVLVERILGHEKPDRYVNELLGGLLVDGVVAAEERQEAILPLLLLSCETAESSSSLSALLTLLKTWIARAESPRPLFERAARKLRPESRALLSQIIGINAEVESSRLRYFLGSAMRPEDETTFSGLEEKARGFAWWATYSEGANLGNAVLHTIDPGDSVSAVIHSFLQVVFLAPYVRRARDFHIRIAWLAGNRFLSPIWDRHLALALDRDRAMYLAVDPNWARAVARYRAQARHLDVHLITIPDLATTRDLTWNDFLSSPTVFGPYLSQWVLGFRLSPQPLWTEFLRARVLPSLPRRAKLHDEELWATTTGRMRSSSFSDLDQWLAARHILVEADFVSLGVFDASKPNPLTGLAEATRDSEFPAIRIAHAIRDISYKKESGIGDLRALLGSGDSAYRSIFRGAYWID